MAARQDGQGSEHRAHRSADANTDALCRSVYPAKRNVDRLQHRKAADYREKKLSCLYEQESLHCTPANARNFLSD